MNKIISTALLWITCMAASAQSGSSPLVRVHIAGREASKKMPANIFWINPNFDEFTSTSIRWDQAMLPIKLKIISNDPIKQGDIKVMIDGKLQASEKFSESLLQGESHEYTYNNVIHLEETTTNKHGLFDWLLGD